MPDKFLVHSTCIQMVEEKIQHLRQSIADARDASNNDTKSSMGDKYETTREMMQIELDKLGKQLHEAQQMLMGLKVLDPAKKHSKVEPGTLLVTDKAVFFLAVGLGKVLVAKDNIMVVSPASPIGRVMLQKSAKEKFQLNGVSYEIQDLI
jgi:transcription elongation GreA/GreB family factor